MTVTITFVVQFAFLGMSPIIIILTGDFSGKLKVGSSAPQLLLDTLTNGFGVEGVEGVVGLEDVGVLGLEDVEVVVIVETMGVVISGVVSNVGG